MTREESSRRGESQEEAGGSRRNKKSRLEAIRQAIHEYRIRGIARLREELASSVGTLIINEDLIKRFSDKEEVQEFGKLITKLATYSSLASNVIKIAESVIKYLPPI
jgi:hypothetical protein